MTEVAPEYVRQAIGFIGQEISQRRIRNQPVPPSLLKLHAALTTALSADGQLSCAKPVDPERLKTTEQLAAEWHCTARTVRRKAEAAGGRKINGRLWIFDQEQT